MKLTYRIEGDRLQEPVKVSLDQPSPHKRGLLSYEGIPEDVNRVADVIKYSYGAFGHLIGEITSQLDMVKAIPRLKGFKAILVEGIEPKPDQNTPLDSQT